MLLEEIFEVCRHLYMKVNMKTSIRMQLKSCRPVLLLILLGLLANVAQAFTLDPPSGTNYPSYIPLDSWSFNDTTNWTSNKGYFPISFTNLTASDWGDGSALLLNSTNPAWLRYNMVETNGSTNLTVNVGSVTFWFAPAWAGTNQGGSGPGEWGRLLEVGGYTPNSSFGLWSLYVDNVGANIYFSAQTNDFSSNFCTYVTAPIAWTTNYWHFIAFTYSATNTALYLDGTLATNGPPLTNYPGPLALANGFFVGSDSNGIYQAAGMIDDLYTYSTPLDADTIANTYDLYSFYYYGNPFNRANIVQAPSTPDYTSTYDVITGNGALHYAGAASSCTSGSTANDIWLTNVTATVTSNGTLNVTFSIEGGAPGIAYDVFANSELGVGAPNQPWTWMGQGYPCTNYMLMNLPSTACFLILGTPQFYSTNGITNALTDAYEELVLQMNPQSSQFDSFNVPYAWYAENGLLPLTSGLATQDPDQDGLLNYQEYQYGTNPKVAEGFTIWVSTTSSTAGIP